MGWNHSKSGVMAQVCKKEEVPPIYSIGVGADGIKFLRWALEIVGYRRYLEVYKR